MPHTLPAPLWSNPDARRCKSALAAELTPLSLDKEAGNASFAGSKEIYWTDLSQCTCLDFHINQARSSPCKHMIRLAMELKLIPSEGKKDDIEAAQYKVALAEIKSAVSDQDLLTAVKVGAFLRELYVDGKSKLVNHGGIETSPLRFFFVYAGSIAKPIKTRKKDALGLVKNVEARLGEWLLGSPEALNAIYDYYASEE